MKNIFNIALTGVMILLLVSCGDERPTERSVQYMGDTDMYEPVPYETYGENPYFSNGINAQLPVAGTIARGATVYEYPDSEVGYQMAKDSLRAPFQADETVLAKGKVTYQIYCTACHGDKGDGMGTLVKNEKFLGVPNYKDRDINQGTIYHVIMYGRNLMGSHAGQLTEAERWNVIHYVEQLRADLLK